MGTRKKIRFRVRVNNLIFSSNLLDSNLNYSKLELDFFSSAAHLIEKYSPVDRSGLKF